MVGIRVAFDAEVGIEVGGRVERECIDPCERLYGYDAPFSSHRIIDVEEWNNFCVNIRLGTTFRQLVDPVDRGIMILIQLDGMEVLRRLVTRRGFSHVGLAQPLRLNYRGALSLDSSHGSQLRRFQFAGANGKRAINCGSIRVELFLVKLLRPPKRSKLVDTVPLEEFFRGISLSSSRKVFQDEAETYEIQRLNWQCPLGRFSFRYRLHSARAPVYINNGYHGISDGTWPPLEPLKSLGLTLQYSNFVRLDIDAGSSPELMDLGEVLDNECGNAAVRVKREEPDDDVVQPPHSEAGKAVVSNKRKVDSALGYTSPPRPAKFVALDMDELEEPEEPEVSEECQHQKAIKTEPEPPVQPFGELEMDS
ncbi:hypothetical protein Cob_v003689 [Colletotrichum orbiculare MAFF 240422]|uniref:Uncharacterized protein n=1 Tax=Colletotrichum orbiculare (strain 104-T / ATCC 96160 / CBS 514.97 / LARS 414 / MAFF 240422) TaxID=1213857 RepID=N4VZD9_COLOR|nr:hypothetical protein Cob_v003689 [Colletotrichum orbiculare MAFF 240422]